MLRSPTGKHWVQSAVHIAIMARLGVYSKRGQFPLWAAAGRRDHDRLAGAPDSGAAAYLLRSGPFASVLQGPSANARRAAAARPGSAISGGKSLSPGRCAISGGHVSSPDIALGQRRRRQPRQTKLHPRPTTERNRIRNGVTVCLQTLHRLALNARGPLAALAAALPALGE